MERFLARLERRLGHLVVPNISTYIIGLMALFTALQFVRPGTLERMVLVPHLVFAGEYWRLVTWMFMPPTTSMFWAVFIIMLYHTILTSLEQEWGTFKLQVYLLCGVLCATVLAMVMGLPTTNEYMLMSLFLAFATLFPDYQILLFFILPVKVKWLGLLSGAGLLLMMVQLPGLARLVPVVAVGNYLLFFAPALVDLLRGFKRQAGRRQALHEFKAKSEEARPATRTCARCGITDSSHPQAEFRVCICQEKCHGQPTVFCLDHVKEH